MATVYVFYCLLSYVSIGTEERCLEFCQRGGMSKIFRLPCTETSIGASCKEANLLDSNSSLKRSQMHSQSHLPFFKNLFILNIDSGEVAKIAERDLVDASLPVSPVGYILCKYSTIS